MSLFKRLLNCFLMTPLAVLVVACGSVGNPQLTAQSRPCLPALSDVHTPVQWQTIGPNLWLHLAFTDTFSNPLNQGHISNIVFALDPTPTGARGWLVGSGPDAATGRALACSLQRTLGATVTDVISARAHPESVLGAAGLPQVRHWALAPVLGAMKERCEHCLKRLELAVNSTTPLVEKVSLPNHLITDPQLGPFDVLSDEVQPQQAITLIYHRASKTWILPGLVWGLEVAPDLREAQATDMLRVLQRLALIHPARIVPEQGAVGDETLIAHNLSYWQRLLAELNSRWQRGESQPGYASGLLPTSAIGASPSTRLRDRLNAQRAWQQIENSGFENLPAK